MTAAAKKGHGNLLFAGVFAGLVAISGIGVLVSGGSSPGLAPGQVPDTTTTALVIPPAAFADDCLLRQQGHTDAYVDYEMTVVLHWSAAQTNEADGQAFSDARCLAVPTH